MLVSCFVNLSIVFSVPSLLFADAGFATYEGQRFEFAFMAAAERQNEFDPDETELALVVSDAPVTDEDVADDMIEHDISHLSFVFRKGKLWSVTFHRGPSETSFGEGLKFSGELKKDIKGRIYTDGPVDVMGSAVEIDIQVDAQIANKKTLDSRILLAGAKAEKSEFASSLRALTAAIAEERVDDVKSMLSPSWLQAFEEDMYSQVSMLSYSFDMPEDFAAEKVTRHQGVTRLYMRTEDRLGVAKFEEHDGKWFFESVSWKYTW